MGLCPSFGNKAVLGAEAVTKPGVPTYPQQLQGQRCGCKPHSTEDATPTGLQHTNPCRGTAKPQPLCTFFL